MTATISVLSYNLKDYGKSAVATRRQQHELLRFERPDVLCLQEVWDDGVDLSVLDGHVATIGDAVGMRATAVPVRRSCCHMAILWRPEFAALSQRSHGLTLWHGLGVVQLDVGAAVPLRVAVTHLAPWDPEQRLADVRTVTGLLDDPSQATVIAGDWYSFRLASSGCLASLWAAAVGAGLWVAWDCAACLACCDADHLLLSGRLAGLGYRACAPDSAGHAGADRRRVAVRGRARRAACGGGEPVVAGVAGQRRPGPQHVGGVRAGVEGLAGVPVRARRVRVRRSGAVACRVGLLRGVPAGRAGRGAACGLDMEPARGPSGDTILLCPIDRWGTSWSSGRRTSCAVHRNDGIREGIRPRRLALPGRRTNREAA
jgi:hypothetical protein